MSSWRTDGEWQSSSQPLHLPPHPLPVQVECSLTFFLSIIGLRDRYFTFLQYSRWWERRYGRRTKLIAWLRCESYAFAFALIITLRHITSPCACHAAPEVMALVLGLELLLRLQYIFTRSQEQHSIEALSLAADPRSWLFA